MQMLPNVSSSYIEDKQLFELTVPLTIFGLEIHAGFESDGFSVPWYLQWYVGRVDKGWIAAWFHDYCYTYAIESKEYADRMFYILLRQCGVEKKKAKKMYWAVKKYGKGNY